MDYSMTLKRALSLSLIVGFLCVGAVGCGDDSDDGGGSGGTAGTGTGGTSGTGTGGTSGTGTGGTSGTGTGGTSGTGTGGMGGSGGMPAPMPMMCGATMCSPISAGGNMLFVCCPGGDACGAVTGMDSAGMPVCTELGQEGVLDEDSMPCTTTKNALNMDTPGCCRPDNKCGFLSMSLMGCIERTAYPAAFLVDPMMPVTDSIDCVYETDSDAGIE